MVGCVVYIPVVPATEREMISLIVALVRRCALYIEFLLFTSIHTIYVIFFL
jgi:hypothetical protein